MIPAFAAVTAGKVGDQIIKQTAKTAQKKNLKPIRRVEFYNKETSKR